MLDFSRANHHLEIPTMNQLLAVITMNRHVDGASECELLQS